MEKTNPKTLEEIIRVDHAGERGAIKIYEGQLLALKTIKQDKNLRDKIEKMKEHEKEHLEYFEKEIQNRKIKPTYFLPLWDVMGVALGFIRCFLTSNSLLSSCLASTQRSSTKVSSTFDQSKFSLDSSSNKLIGVRPPETAILAQPFSVID